MNILERMKKLGIKQVDMILKLRQRGIIVQPPEMSGILRGINTYPKAKKVLEASVEVLDEWEKELGAER